MFASKDIFLTPPSGGYNIARSVRLRSSASAYLSRTPASAGNRQIFTISAWIKRGSLSVSDCALFTATDGTNRFYSRFESDDKFYIYVYVGGTAYEIATAMVFRDPSAWYHIVLVVDTTQATNTNRMKIYVNGVQQTFTGTYAPQNTSTQWNNTVQQNIGKKDTSGSYFDGYLTEINSIDGQALTPSSFGSTNAITGVWQPAKYTGTYGTNGFYLNFSDNSNNTATTIGKDYSGNGNNWTPNNISVTAGVTYDSMTDVPTLTSATAANYCTLNPIAPGDYFTSGQTAFALTNGNLSYGATGRNSFGSIAVSSGKWYWEMVNTSNTTAATALFGLVTVASRTAVYACYYNAVNGNKGLGTLNSGSTETAYGATWTDNDVIGVAVDMSAATPTVTFYKNNTSQGAISVSSFVGQSVMMWIQNGGNTNNMSGNVNFGQRAFTYTPPTDYVALNTYNLPDSTIKNGAAYMAASLYTGTNANLTVTNTVNGTGMQPDLVWMKIRSTSASHVLIDSVRGVTKTVNSDLTNAESTSTGTSGLLSFNSNGFSLGTDSSATGSTNGNGNTYVAWQWKAGGTSSSNTNGSITSTVSVGATQGFSVVTYTGTGVNNATVGHGLGVAPSMIIVKSRTQTYNWDIYHQSLGITATLIFTTAATRNVNAFGTNNPTSSVFSVYSGYTNDTSANLVAYCFSAVKGFSAFGSYTGNNSADGPFVYTGFRPRWILFKDSTSAATNWVLQDTSRFTYNLVTGGLLPNTSASEYSSGYDVDILSNGFKIRRSGGDTNQSSANIIYAAFAENPFKNSLAR